MSTYSPSLRIELITTGDQAGTWGTTTNTNLGTLIESAIAGYVSVSITAANQALTAVNGAADQSRNMTLAFTTTTGAPFNVYAPPAEKTYIVYNASAHAATIYNSTILGNTTAAGTGVAIPAGKTVTVWSDGTNFVFQNNHLPSLTLATDLAVADGGTGASTAADARTNLGLGTLATQNANSASITGGSITGITDLAVADGGTGASNAATAQANLDVPSRAGTGASGTWAISISGSSASTTGNAATATALQTARTIGGVSFNGTANINLPGVNTAGNQNTTGSAASVSGTTTAAVLNSALATGTADATTFLRGDRTWGTAGLSASSTAQAQAGTDNSTAITPLRMREGFNASGTAPVFACRAWVNFNGAANVGGSNPLQNVIRASGNVSSITDNGVGDYTVNFATAMPDINYCVQTTGDDIDCGTMIVGNGGGPGVAPTTTAIRVFQFLSDVNIYKDAVFFCVAIFR